jgi:hypothetical protein
MKPRPQLTLQQAERVWRLLDALEEIAEIADDRADVDDGIPNAWMRVLTIAKDALK